MNKNKKAKTLVEKYCRKNHIPYDESIGNTFGFLSYQFNYQACKLRSEIIKEAEERWEQYYLFL